MDCFDRHGRPISLAECARLLADEAYRRVASTTVGPYLVSTVWLGVDHGHGAPGGPVAFETMVFAADTTIGTVGEAVVDLDCRRYRTEAEARAGHDETVALVHATYQPGPWEEPATSTTAPPTT